MVRYTLYTALGREYIEDIANKGTGAVEVQPVVDLFERDLL